MLLGTHARQTTLCVTFGARLRSVPPHLLDRLFGARTANAAQAFRNGVQMRTAGAAKVSHGCLQQLTILSSGAVSSP